MIILTQEQRNTLEPLIPNLNDLVENDDLPELLDILDDLIIDEMYDHFEKMTRKGIKLQIMYDQIFYANE